MVGGPPSANGDGWWRQGGKPGGKHEIWRGNNAGANLRHQEGRAALPVGTGWRPRSAANPPGDLGPSGRRCRAALLCPQDIPAGSWGQGDMGPSCSWTAAGALSLRAGGNFTSRAACLELPTPGVALMLSPAVGDSVWSPALPRPAGSRRPGAAPATCTTAVLPVSPPARPHATAGHIVLLPAGDRPLSRGTQRVTVARPQ